MPCFLTAEISADGVSPPHASRSTFWSASSFLTRSMLALALSILLMATTIGTLAARAWLIASMVWGITASSAATTRTTMSVARAPRARIEVKASWPGVSRKTIGLFLTSTRYAPMCCVIPPASPAATFVWRIASRRDVLPWST